MGVAAFFIAWNRLYASIGMEGPEWKRNLLSLGLRVEQQSKPRPELDLATAKDFSKVSVYGDFALEIVGSAQYKVTFMSADGTTAKVHAYLDEGYLRVHTEDEVKGGTLHIEVPTLQRIDANVPPNHRARPRGQGSRAVWLSGWRRHSAAEPRG